MESLYQSLVSAVESVKEDLDKFIQKKNQSAAVRARKKLQTVRNIAQDLRVKIHENRKQKTEV